MHSRLMPVVVEVLEMLEVLVVLEVLEQVVVVGVSSFKFWLALLLFRISTN